MGVVNSPILTPRTFQYHQVARNGFYPAANTQLALAETANHINEWCTKAIEFRCPISAIPALSATARTRWRGVIHTSPFAENLFVKFEAAQINDNLGTAHASKDPFVKVLVEDSGGTDIGTAEFHFGYSVGSNDTPNTFGTIRLPIVDANGVIVQVDPSTDYFISVSDEQSARAIGVSIYERHLGASTANGYARTEAVAGSPILSADRQTLLTNLRNQWTDGAAGLWHWASNTDATAPTRTGGDQNIIDASSTTPSASTPGATLDLRNRSTVRRSTVPCIWYVNASRTAGTAGVSIGINGGTVIATITPTTSSPAWYSTTFDLPATLTKYDILHSCSGGTVTTYASSLLMLE